MERLQIVDDLAKLAAPTRRNAMPGFSRFKTICLTVLDCDWCCRHAGKSTNHRKTPHVVMSGWLQRNSKSNRQ